MKNRKYVVCISAAKPKLLFIKVVSKCKRIGSFYCSYRHYENSSNKIQKIWVAVSGLKFCSSSLKFYFKHSIDSIINILQSRNSTRSAEVMLIGEYTHSIDIKGRTSLPAKFKKEVGKRVYVTRGSDSCLSVYTAKSWKVLSEKLMSLPITGDRNYRDFNRMMLSGAVEASIDGQGRILIPEYLRTHAGLEKKIVWAGVGDMAEIWSEKSWQENIANITKNPEKITESLGGVI